MKKRFKVDDLVLQMNYSLCELEKEMMVTNMNTGIPPVFIIGAPRSGTTIVNQIMASAFTIAYIDNISAKFWEAPSVGLTLSNQISPFKNRIIQKYSSAFGFTEEAIGPHEFGYFWQKWFNFDELHELTPGKLEAIDKEALKRQIYTMTNELGLPVIFKNTASLTFQAEFLYELFPDAFFIFCLREPLYNAQSLAECRVKYHGSPDEWFSVKPKNYFNIKLKTPAEQVMNQLASCTQKIQDLQVLLERKNSKRYTNIDYINLCHNPNQVIDNITEMFRQNELNVERKQFSMKPLFSTDRQKVSDVFFEELMHFRKIYFG